MTIDKTTSSTGIQLEARVQRLLFNQGYFAVRDIFIPGRYQASGASTPDIDVFGYLFSQDFTSIRVIYDCKSGRSHPVNRVLWLQTLARRIHADRIYLVRPNTKKHIKFYGLAEGVHFIDFSVLDRMEQDNIEATPVRGSSATEYLGAASELQRSTRNQQISRAMQLIHSDFWFLPSCSAVKRAIAQYESIAAISTLPGLSPRGLQWLKSTLISLFTIGVLRICSEVNNLDQDERAEILKQRLVSDRIPYERFISLVRSSFEYAHSVYGKQQGLPLGNFYNIPPPPYTDSLLDLIERALKHPREAVLMPLFSEHILFDYVLPGVTINPQAIELVFRRPYTQLLSHYRDYIFFLSRISPSIKDFLQILLSS